MLQYSQSLHSTYTRVPCNYLATLESEHRKRRYKDELQFSYPAHSISLLLDAFCFKFQLPEIEITGRKFRKIHVSGEDAERGLYRLSKILAMFELTHSYQIFLYSAGFDVCCMLFRFSCDLDI